MDTRSLFNSLSVVGLNGNEVEALVNKLDAQSVETCVRNEILPDIGAYCYDYISAISKRTDNIPIVYKFLAPKLFNTKLDDVPESKFAFSRYLTDDDYSYYLQDTNLYKVTLLFRDTKHRHRLIELLPSLTVNTHRIVDILCNYIYAGIDVKELANQCVKRIPDHMPENLAILVFYTDNHKYMVGRTIYEGLQVNTDKASSEYIRLYKLMRTHRAIPF